jgi:hypothetical protein
MSRCPRPEREGSRLPGRGVSAWRVGFLQVVELRLPDTQRRHVVQEGDRLVGIISEADLRRDEGPKHSQQQTPTQRWLSTVGNHRCG